MSDFYLWSAPVLALGVLALAGFIGCDRFYGLSGFTSDNPFIIGENLTTPRNDFTGWVGMVVVPTPSQQTLYAIGRYCVAGNALTHDLKIVDAASGADVPGSAAIIDLAGQPANQFVFAQFGNVKPVLEANLKYYVLSHETSGGDQFFDFTTTVQIDGAADMFIPAAVFGDPTGPTPIPFTEMGNANQSYGPVNLHFVKGD